MSTASRAELERMLERCANGLRMTADRIDELFPYDPEPAMQATLRELASQARALLHSGAQHEEQA